MGAIVNAPAAGETEITFIARNVSELRGEVGAHILEDAVRAEKITAALEALAVVDKREAEARASRERTIASLFSAFVAGAIGLLCHKLIGWP